jgi:hypothetical protein
MHIFAQKPKSTQPTSSQPIRPGRAHLGQSLHLQRTIGNQAVQRLLEATTEGVKRSSPTTETSRFSHDFGSMPFDTPTPIAQQGERSGAAQMRDAADRRTWAGLQAGWGNQAGLQMLASARSPIPAKLAMSQPGDPQELEADRMADGVLRTAAPMRVPRTETAESDAGVREQGGAEVAVDQDLPLPETPMTGVKVQRMCHECEEEHKVHAKGNGPPMVAAGPVMAGLGGGRPLPAAQRAFFEPRFGYAFDRVKIHTDSAAAEAARAVSARAFTLGNDLVFAKGQFAPETQDGRRLLAHELAHVIQQNPSAGGKPALKRWHADGPADTSTNTIVCDGKGGVRTQLGGTGSAAQAACLSGCMDKHEQSHRSDALSAKKDVCKDQKDGTQVTFNGEQKASEIKASNVEIDCLNAKLPKAGADCKEIIKSRITQMKGYRDSFK